ncbi:MAG: exonuclease SbcCD subunit D [Dehalococcoidia bacterium]|nr:exonuclease SbcCD subunit D [Dehalococcoidia bacterium]
MKIIHFADLHLGVETYGHIDAQSGLSTRLRDFTDSFDRLIDYAIDNNADLVLFCGDAYKNRNPSQTQQREFARRIKRLSQHGIPVFLLSGNHDMHNAYGRATAIEIFDTLAIEGVTVANKPGLHRIETPSGTLQIVALPWLKRSNIVGQEASAEMDFALLNQKMQQGLADVIARLSESLDPSLPAVLAAHVWVQSARTGTEDTMIIGQEHMLLPGTVALPCFDYVALGHIHRHQVLNRQPPVVYSGSLERLDFGDEDDEKGFYVVEIKNFDGIRHTTFEFNSIAGRRFLKIAARIEDWSLDPTGAALAAITPAVDDIRGNIVRLELSLPQDSVAMLDENRLRQAASEAYYFSIVRNIRKNSRPLPEGMAIEALSAADALDVYLRTKSAEYPRADKLLRLGHELITAAGDSPPFQICNG